MPRRPTEESLKIRALARAHGKTERWARKQRERNTQIWNDFGEGLKIELPTTLQTDREKKEKNCESDLTRAECVCGEAWKTWEGMNVLLTAALKDESKQDIIPALARSAREARKQWEDATKHKEALLKASGLWIHVDRVTAIRAHIKSLSSVFSGLEVSIAGRIDPQNRHEFYRAFSESMPEWNNGVRKIDEYITSLLPC